MTAPQLYLMGYALWLIPVTVQATDSIPYCIWGISEGNLTAQTTFSFDIGSGQMLGQSAKLIVRFLFQVFEMTWAWMIYHK